MTLNHKLAAGIVGLLAFGVSACSLTDNSALGSGGSAGGASGGSNAGGAAGGGANTGGTSGAGASARAVGERCTVSEQCQAGVCADGVCCQTKCDGGCEACSAAAKGGGADGECGPVAQGSDPRGNCSDQGPESCGDTGACDGAGACAKYAANTLCTTSRCDAGVRTLPRQCDGAGTCVDAGTQACEDGECTGTVCHGQCEHDTDCSSAEFCDAVSGACTPKRANGTTCQSNLPNQCQSGICADGVCCDTSCSGKCEGCASGACTPHRAGEDPESDCTGAAPESCADDGMCDGSGGCRKWLVGTPCGTDACAGSTYTPAAQCDGSGSCATLGSVGCAPYVCAGDRCGDSCASAADCAPGVLCDAATHTCKSPLPSGAACSSAAQCASGYRVDGRCCTTACDGPCEACSVAKRGVGLDGECGAVAAGTDPDKECLDEGVASCGHTGVCSGGLSCASYGAGSVCEPAACIGSSTLQPAGTCLAGSCDTPRPRSCSPYLCAGDACATSCLVESDCASGFYCTGVGTCMPKALNGNKCSKPAQCSSGFCADGYCCDSPCDGICQTCGTGGEMPVGSCGWIPCGAPGVECGGGKRCTFGGCKSMCELIE